MKRDTQNLIFPIEMMDLTIEPPVYNIGIPSAESYIVGAPMTREYDLFEKFPDGSSLWRVSVSGLGNARLYLHELTRKSENQFYAIDMTAGKTLFLGRELDPLGLSAPRKSRGQSSQKIA
jgi:hypothetical protein